MNTFVNLKTAEKGLQFGVSKCRTMLVGKDTKGVPNTDIMVDVWDTKYEEDTNTGNVELVETFTGLTTVKKTEEQKYLGFVISSTGNNMANITNVKNKSIGTTRKIICRLNNANLQKYYFECSNILMNVMLRGSTLYACEVYYNLKESEIRHLERIEESFLRQILKTSRGCPIVQLYLEMGIIPARFHIQKMRLLYLKYILEQNEHSLLRKCLKLQLEQPSKNDWASTCVEDLKKLQIDNTFEEIKLISKNKFKNILKQRIKELALNYLKAKQNIKGKEITYSDIDMAEYLQPINSKLNIEQKRKMFAVRNMMVDIPSNFSKSKGEKTCICKQEENMKHIYNCEVLNSETHKLPFEKIFSGNMNEQIEVFKRFDKNFETRNKLKSENSFPCDPNSDPLSLVKCTVMDK